MSYNENGKTIVVLGYGMVGALAVLTAIKKRHDEIKEMVIVDREMTGGNSVRPLGIKWFYNTCTSILFDELGIDYQMKYHTGAVYVNGSLEIFPQYVMSHVDIVNEYAEKLKIQFIKDKNNVMNTPFTNEKGNRLYYDVNMRLVYYVITNKIKSLASEYGIKLTFLIGEAESIDVIKHRIFLSINDSTEMDKVFKLRELSLDYSDIITTIPFNALVKTVKNIDRNKFFIFDNNFDREENFYVCLSNFVNKDKNVWWDYIYVPELKYKLRRISAINRGSGVMYLCESVDYVGNRDIDNEFREITNIRSGVTFNGVRKINSIIKRDSDVHYVLRNYDIVSFGREATQNSRELINTAYENIVKYYSFNRK